MRLVSRAAAIAATIVLGAGVAACDGEESGDSPLAEPFQPDDAVPEPETPNLSQSEVEGLYTAVKKRLEAGVSFPVGAGDENFAEVEADLRLVIELSQDVHLRANASLLLGSLFEERGDRRSAISFYRQAQKLLPEEPSPRAVLALALSAEERWTEAITEQTALIEMVPDDLQARLLLGEMNAKAGRDKAAAQSYAAYELRRKGLIDGLTLTEGGKYIKPPQERALCANLLAPAADNGTALALMTAFTMDPEATVRVEIVGSMGEQRLRGYTGFLEEYEAKETDDKVKEAIRWALQEIERDPVDSTPGAAPDVDAAGEPEASSEGEPPPAVPKSETARAESDKDAASG